jgi:hypothetical protein
MKCVLDLLCVAAGLIADGLQFSARPHAERPEVCPSDSSFSGHHLAQFYVAAFAGPAAKSVTEPAGCLVSVQNPKVGFHTLLHQFLH